jgi:hypothetical protein
VSNRQQGIRFRELVTLVLANRGVTNATVRPDHGRLSTAVLADDELGDVQGLGDWLLNTRNEATRDLSGSLDHARHQADLESKKFAAVAFHRPGRPAEDSYVLTTLADFAAMLVEKGSR